MYFIPLTSIHYSLYLFLIIIKNSLKIHNMIRFTILLTSVFMLLMINSCTRDNKQNKSSLGNLTDGEIEFAHSLYGKDASIIASGDLLANGKLSAIAGIVKQKNENSFWIEKASLFQKESENWKVILKMDKKLSSNDSELINQVEAQNGYIISFDTVKMPVTIYIVLASEYGKAASEEAVLKWNKEKEVFEFITPTDEVIP